jgi:flagellar basal body-associated protein FliL
LSGGNYNRLDEEGSGSPRRWLRDVEEGDEAIGYDLSSLGGLPMSDYNSQSRIDSTEDAKERDRNEASHAAEFESLEAQLGAGMTSILQKPFTHTPIKPIPGSFPGHRRILSASEVADAHAKDAQIEANKTNKMVAVAEVPYDMSDFTAGSDFDARSTLTDDTGLAKDSSQTSYFFPEGEFPRNRCSFAQANITLDPQMPAWRPATMSQLWILLLVVIAILLAGVQEGLYWLSRKRIEEDPTNGGLKSFEDVSKLTVSEYFAWKYAPIMGFVFYGILWQMTDFEVKRLEPFYQLSKKTGATAGESLNMDYLTFTSWLVPLRALRHRQYAVIYSSLGTLISSSLVPVLQSASITMHVPKVHNGKNAENSIRVEPIWSRLVSACLIIVAFCGAALIYAMRRKSGLQSNPQGIAGIAAMATKSHILNDFRGLDQAPLKDIHKQLRHRRYILHKSSLWQGEYIKNSTDKTHEQGTDPRPFMLRKRSGVPFIAFIIAFAAAIPVVMVVDGADIVTDTFPVMTGLAVIIKILWNTVNCDVRMLQPFYILSRRHAPAKTLTLDYAGTNLLWLPIKALINGHYLVMLVAFGSILTEVLTVCVSSISVDGRQFIQQFIPGLGDKDVHRRHNASSTQPTEQTKRSFWTSFALSILILVYLVVVAIITYKKRSQKFMPRQIGTMASVLAFIHQSKMLFSFVDTETFDSRKMTKHLEKSGKTYALGWFRGRDGDDHLGIDEEEIYSNYIYGKDWTDGRLRPGQEQSWDQL